MGQDILASMSRTAENIFDGCWLNQDSVPVATIVNGVVSWANGPSAELEQQSKNSFSVRLDGYTDKLTAHCTEDGKLTWSDGEIWKHSGPQTSDHADVARKRIGAGGGATPDGGDGMVHFYSSKKPGGRRVFGQDDLDQPADGEGMVLKAGTWGCEQLLQLDINHAKLSGVAMGWINFFGALAPDAPEEVPRVRCLYNSITRVALIELASLATTNMMDPELCVDMTSVTAALKVMQRQYDVDGGPRAFVWQAVGPHFCPGGNHHPLLLDDTTLWYAHTYTGSQTMSQIQEIGIPGFCCQHGANVGGGAAMSLNASYRITESRMSLSFGNLSRGACPIMNLSRHLPAAVGRPNAVGIYLSDDTFSSYTVLVGGWAKELCNGVPNMKRDSLLLAQREALGSTIGVTHMHVDIEFDHYARENEGFIYSAKMGQMFANAKIAKKEPIIPTQDAKDVNNLKLEVPEGRTVLAMKMTIEATWKIPVEDQVLELEDGTILDDDDKKITDDMKVKLKLTDVATAKAEWEQQLNSTDYGEDYEEDYDYGWGGDYDYDDEDDYDEE